MPTVSNRGFGCGKPTGVLCSLLRIPPAKRKHKQTALVTRRFIGRSREHLPVASRDWCARRGMFAGMALAEVQSLLHLTTLRCPNNWQSSRRLPSCDGHQFPKQQGGIYGDDVPGSDLSPVG